MFEGSRKPPELTTRWHPFGPHTQRLPPPPPVRCLFLRGASCSSSSSSSSSSIGMIRTGSAACNGARASWRRWRRRRWRPLSENCRGPGPQHEILSPHSRRFTPCISSHQQGTEPHAQRPPRGTHESVRWEEPRGPRGGHFSKGSTSQARPTLKVARCGGLPLIRCGAGDATPTLRAAHGHRLRAVFLRTYAGVAAPARTSEHAYLDTGQ
jgi:hypothetical protein